VNTGSILGSRIGNVSSSSSPWGVGIQSSGTGRLTVYNEGTIDGYYGIFASTWVDLENSGTIFGELRLSGGASITNTGTIHGAIEAGFSVSFTSVLNTGTITGRVYLGDGNDSFINDGGTVRWIQGGAGNDTYQIDRSDIRVVELENAGRDTVASSVSLRIPVNVEVLQLIDANGLSGWGRRTNDVIHGGEGNDTIYGAGGNDTLHGGNGDDRVFGEGGNDELLSSYSGHSSLYGAAGDDVGYWVGAGSDLLFDGGTGRDKLIVGGGAACWWTWRRAPPNDAPSAMERWKEPPS
jgi:Ca2+-binding RTX toxin-like protein